MLEKMTESTLWDKAYALRQEGKFKEAYDVLCEIATGGRDPMEKASALLGGITDLITLKDFRSACKQLETIKSILARSDATPTLNQDQRLRLNAEADLQEALIAVAQAFTEEQQKETLAAFDSMIKKYGPSLDVPFLKDIKEAIYGERAFILADLGFFTEALPALQEVEVSHPKNSSVIFYLGYCHWSTKNYHLARKTLEKAIALGLSGNFEFRAHLALGCTLCETGYYGHARVELERARALATPYDLTQGKVFQWLEYCYKQLGMTNEAAQYAHLHNPKQ
jgi:tetratricopeptide (TPR) repeat protein